MFNNFYKLNWTVTVTEKEIPLIYTHLLIVNDGATVVTGEISGIKQFEMLPNSVLELTDILPDRKNTTRDLTFSRNPVILKLSGSPNGSTVYINNFGGGK